MDYDDLIDILESSVEKHGEKPLTNRWLLNILRMAERRRISKADYDSWDFLTMDDIC